MRRSLVTTAVVAAITLAPASLATAEPVVPAPPGTNMAAWSAVPIPAGRVDAALADLDRIAERALATSGVPGMSISVVHQGRTVYARGFGVRDVRTGAPVDADTVFQLASVSKTIAASVVSSVIGTTDIEWTDPVVDHLPYFALSDPYVTRNATIGDMFAMRSGLPHEAGDDIAELGLSRREVIKQLKVLPLAPFRAKHLYANYSLTIGAEAVAQAVGVPWNQLSQERIYDPLGMTSTTSSVLEFRRFPNRAILHVPSGDAWVANGTRDEEAQSPAGMVASSASDMARWMTMELANGSFGGRQVVDSTALQQTRVPRSLTTPNADTVGRAGFYGYGTTVRTDATGRVRWGHSGAFSQGASTTVTLLPAEGLGITVLTNGYPMGVPEAVAAEFLDLVELGVSSTDWLADYGKQFAALLGSGPAPQPPADPAPAGPLGRYVGTYGNRYYGDLVVRRQGKGLLALIGPHRLPLQLVPYDGLTFAMPDGTPVITFSMRDGRIATAEVTVLRAPGQSLFVRR